PAPRAVRSCRPADRRLQRFPPPPSEPPQPRGDRPGVRGPRRGGAGPDALGHLRAEPRALPRAARPADGRGAPPRSRGARRAAESRTDDSLVIHPLARLLCGMLAAWGRAVHRLRWWLVVSRSEERRVGKAGRARRAPER